MRSRNHKNRDLEEFVCVDRKANGVVYYSYKLPNGKKKSIKRPSGASDSAYKKHANQLARKLNHQLGRDQSEEDAQAILNEYIMASDGFDKGQATIAKIIDKFKKEFLPEKRHAPSTLANKHYMCDQYKKLWGSMSIYDLSLKFISDHFETLTPAAYIKHRAFWIDVFAYSISKGISVENQPLKTLKKREERRKRKRLTLEWFKLVHEAAPEWYQRVMDFALLTLQRRGDLVRIKKEDILPANTSPDYRVRFTQDKKGAEIVHFDLQGYYWTNPQSGERQLIAKTSARKAYDEGQRLNEAHGCKGPRRLFVIQNKTVKHGSKACVAIDLTPDMEDVVTRCMRSDTVSPMLLHWHPKWIIHHKHRHWTSLTEKRVTETFTEIASQLPAFEGMSVAERPSFHEIRSLGASLYEAKFGKVEGKKYANGLMGHTTEEMTDHYLEGHAIVFTQVSTYD